MKRDDYSDQQLVEEILGGNKELFRLFISRYERLVRHVVSRMLTNSTDCDDLAQDVFVKVYQNLSGFQFNSKLSTWVGRIAYNSCLNHLDKKRALLVGDLGSDDVTMDSWSDPGSITEGLAENNDIAVRISTEIDRLPVIYGTILSLFHLQEMRYAEIAELLSLPEGTVKSYLFRARKMLKERLIGQYDWEELCA